LFSDADRALKSMTQKEAIMAIWKAITMITAGSLALATGTSLSSGQGRSDLKHVSSARALAIHTCSAAAASFSEHTWGNTEFNRYRACMAEHGQME
jgi:hypothetical protein